MSRVRRRGALKREGTPGRKKKSTQLSCSPRLTTGKEKGTPSVKRKMGQASLLRWSQNGPEGEAHLREDDGLQAKMNQIGGRRLL
jgi:hypothetical protein